MELALNFHDGEAAAVAVGKKSGAKGPGPVAESGEQGSLL
jgi:hypothetical protein